MAGLINMFDSEPGMLGLLMLNAARPQAGPRNTGGGLLEVAQGLQQFRAAQDAKKAQEEERAMRQQLQQAQLAEMNAQIQQRAAAAAQAQQLAERNAQFRQALSGAGTVSPQQALSGGGGPTPQNAAQIGASQPIDWQSLALKFPEQAEQLAKIAATRNLGRDKVARTIDTVDDRGMPATVQLSDYGDRLGAALPKAIEMKLANLGGHDLAYNPFALTHGQQMPRSVSPDAQLSAQTAMRGQNMSDARAREKNQIDRDAVGKVDWKQDVNGAWIGLPKEVGSGPVTPVTTTAPGKREQQARNALDIISEAEKLIDKGTGSYIGAGVDLVGKAFGGATPGAVAGGQLKALEGALMMAQPRMEGPQSNMDVQLYRQMAAQIGDPTVPPKIKKAALSTIKGIHQKYAGEGQPEGQPSLDDLLKKYGN